MSRVSDTPPQTYGVARWGEGYFGINAEGHVTVHPDPESAAEIDLYGLVEDLTASGLRLPVLVRFDDILRYRVQSLCRAFDEAAALLDYEGGYRAVYPIKVNQQRSVVEQLVAGGGRCIGLEAGSKPELMAVLASAPRGGAIVCNGYKDRQYIRLALIGRRLGYDVYIVIEKLSELDLVFAEAADLGIEPLLGVRVRLSAVAAGKWQNSGGAKSKFGLSSTQVLALVRRLRERDGLHWLRLLHSHIGSQIPDLRDIHRGINEVTRYFAELHRLGADIRVIDVGGGLGIDYEGSRSQHYCSTNYSLRDYATEVLRPIARTCADHGLAQPMVFSESGRAMTAHHAVLITDVIEREAPFVAASEGDASDDELLKHMQGLLSGDDHAAPQRLQNAELLLAEANERFARGDLGLEQRARAETLFYTVARSVKDSLRLNSRRHRETLEMLNELLADRVFCNFSLFQSLPDIWAIDQIFPVMPLHRLNEAPDQAALMHDLTCDSDGCIDSYVDQDGVENTLTLHRVRPGEPYLLGVFLIGAYQEILGDMHNLFGDTDAVNVSLDADGRPRLAMPERGDSVDELLRYVHFDPDVMLETYLRRLREQRVGEANIDSYYRELKAGLHGYTYLGS
ncbi:MAG: biosynthetic arginine decarboxylase [Chromatiaceae bacterium]|nr:biosynthetic arginine decarboxylase [Chromatiaceae bacterium]MCP5422865.1 biosynthetic arginine decarboxylase [Chromatiaceae bacterium]